MAIIKSLAIGKARKSAGNLTYQTVKTRTIVKEKPVNVHNPNSPAQQAQRSKMRNCVEAWRRWYQVLAPFFTKVKGYGTAYNEFIRRNIALASSSWIWEDGGPEYVVLRSGTTVSSGKYGPSAVNVDIDSDKWYVSIVDNQLKNDMLPGDEIIGVFDYSPSDVPGIYLPQIMRHTLSVGDIEVLSAGGIINPANWNPQSVDLYTAFFYSSKRHIASTGIA